MVQVFSKSLPFISSLSDSKYDTTYRQGSVPPACDKDLGPQSNCGPNSGGESTTAWLAGHPQYMSP